MAYKDNYKNTKKTDYKYQNSNNNSKKTDSKNNNVFIMQVLVFIGVLSFCALIFYLMYHFFVEKSNIEVNMSTDKQMEYIKIEGVDTIAITKKYVSDLNYTMRYDTNNFKIFKYRKQDIYKSLEDERILVVVEKSDFPISCHSTDLLNYKNCYIILDDYTEEYYISTIENEDIVYKLTIKRPANTNVEGVKDKIDYMLNTFNIV